jgi:transcriptional regulator with XRE-family HTH domain
VQYNALLKVHTHDIALGVAAMSATEIGVRIRARRQLLQLRQQDLAELADVTLRGIVDLEKGTANPTLLHLVKIANVLGLELNLVERSLHAS